MIVSADELGKQNIKGALTEGAVVFTTVSYQPKGGAAVKKK